MLQAKEKIEKIEKYSPSRKMAEEILKEQFEEILELEKPVEDKLVKKKQGQPKETKPIGEKQSPVEKEKPKQEEEIKKKDKEEK